jgi:hypothetical protein
MKTIVTALLFLIAFNASADWPDAMFTNRTVLANALRPIQSYFKKLNDNWVRVYGQGRIDYYSPQSDLVTSDFTIRIKRTGEYPKAKEYILYEVNGVLTETVLIELNSLPFHDDNSLFNLTIGYPAGEGSMSIIFKELDRSIQIHNEVFGNRSKYVFYGGHVTQHLVERNEVDKDIIKLWLECKRCSGTPLMAYSHVGDYPWYQYFAGKETDEVTPADFYNRANRFYLSSLFGSFGTLAKDAHMFLNWPHVD